MHCFSHICRSEKTLSLLSAIVIVQLASEIPPGRHLLEGRADRLHIIEQELSNSDCPIKQLAWNYNFSDVSFFTRYFRLHTGTTPTAYRKSLIVNKI